MTTPEKEEEERLLDEVRYHPAWHDLTAAGRQRAYDRARALRPLEAALRPAGLSSTARPVLARIER